MRRHLILFCILILLLTGCGISEEEIIALCDTTATADAALWTAVPTLEPTQAPTEAPAVTEPPEPTATTAPSPAPVGFSIEAANFDRLAVANAMPANYDLVIFPTWSPDDSMVAAVAGKHVEVYDPLSGEIMNTLGPLSQWVDSIAWSPDGTKLLAALRKTWEVLVWDPVSGEQLFSILHPDPGQIFQAFWVPSDGRILTVSGCDIHFWDPNTGARLESLNSRCGEKYSWGAFSNDGKRFIVASDRGHDFYNAVSWDERQTILLPRFGSSVWSADGTLIAAIESPFFTKLLIYDVETWSTRQLLEAPTPRLYPPQLSPDAAYVAAASHDTSNMFVWDVANGELLHSFVITSPSDPVWAANSTTLIVGSGSNLYFWDVTSGEQFGALPVSSKNTTQSSLSHDGKMIATGSDAGFLYLSKVDE